MQRRNHGRQASEQPLPQQQQLQAPAARLLVVLVMLPKAVVLILM
jgi:hypothetical protein